MGQPQIHVLLDDPVMPTDVAAALRRMGAGVRMTRLDRELRNPSNTPADARLVIASRRSALPAEGLEAVYRHCDRNPCATLLLTPTPIPDAMLADLRFDEGAAPIGVASGLSADELAGRLTAMCTLQRSFARIRQELDELRRQENVHRRGDREREEQMRLASQLQRDLLPNPLPVMRGATLHPLFRPADAVSGDLYDVTRLGAEQVGLSIADATGHGLPAALLTMFLHRALRGTNGDGAQAVARPPEEVLAELNREILDARLTNCQFLTAVYAMYNEAERTITWSRGGAPYPILIRPGRPAEQIQDAGMVLGVEPDVPFAHNSIVLDSGAVMLFHTDGLEALLLHEGGQRVCDSIVETPWYRGLGSIPIKQAVAEIARRLDAPDRHWPVDDVTILAIQVR